MNLNATGFHHHFRISILTIVKRCMCKVPSNSYAYIYMYLCVLGAGPVSRTAI